ncbi:hypothetical protein QBC47DRAFT_410172 [Echria macrotheca]|uniref:Uncharacterized protein n=1 Tax=Echria macrotheca TaxID=438768 RepID=A0AAJ0BK52_9PEZI|nr:hypothetical protein QBC47DRAFT_410172 [Echria macrotheca]
MSASPHPGSKIEMPLMTADATTTRRRSRSWFSKTSRNVPKDTEASAVDVINWSSGESEGSAARAALLACSHLWATPFPSGEATRISTPPLKPRSLFFDVNPMELQQGPETEPPIPKQRPRGRSETRKPREWWDSPPKSMTRTTTVAVEACYQLPKADLFEFDVSEHLPTSPMCPAHPKNKSGGKGVCVYHGRRKTGENSKEAGVQEKDTAASTPE